MSFLGTVKPHVGTLLCLLVCLCMCKCVWVNEHKSSLPPPILPKPCTFSNSNQGIITKTTIIVSKIKLGAHQRIWALCTAQGRGRERRGWVQQILLGPNLNGPQHVCLPPFVYMAEIWNKCEHDTVCPLQSSLQCLRFSTLAVCDHLPLSSIAMC